MNYLYYLNLLFSVNMSAVKKVFCVKMYMLNTICKSNYWQYWYQFKTMRPFPDRLLHFSCQMKDLKQTRQKVRDTINKSIIIELK